MRRADALWLAGQGVLFVMAFIVLPSTDGLVGRIDLDGARLVGQIIFWSGAAVGIVAMVRLGRQLVPQPTPVRNGTLIDSGLYGVVRHPIYFAVLLLITGSVIRVLSVAGLAVAIASVIFFDRKSAYEESLLTQTYPEYDEYRARVPYKLVPGIR